MNSSKKSSLRRQIYVTFILTLAVILAFLLLFYQISLSSLAKKESQYMNNMLSQVAQQTEDITASIQLVGNTIASSSASVYLLSENAFTQKISYKQTLNRMIAEMSKSNASIKDILLVDLHEKVYGFSNYDYSLASQLNQKYDLFSFIDYPNGFTGALTLSDSTYYAYIQPVYEQGKSIGDRQKLGYCMILCSCDQIAKACSNTSSSENSLFVILDSSSHVLVQNQELNASLTADILPALSSDELSFSKTINGKRYLIHQHPSLSATGWKVSSVIPYSDINADINKTRSVALLLIIILLLAFMTLFRLININLTRPILEIIDFTQKDPYYTLHHSLKINGPPEIEDLAKSINQMLDQINELNHTVLENQSHLYEIELANNRARLYALQSQINPHFLYNTLNAIQGLTFLGKNDEIRTAISSLSYVLRYSVKGDEMTLVKDEIHCIEKYLQIITVRFSQRFNIFVSIDDAILNESMPRFLLQPLVENAIFHGLEPCPDKKSLSLTGTITQNSILHFECIDDGAGIPDEKLTALQELLGDDSKLINNPDIRKHIGLLNIHLRLRLLYGSPYGISLVSSPGKGTKVAVDFPSTSRPSR